jgi:predicted  nucleic acid-binding Zn-ribbon protein
MIVNGTNEKFEQIKEEFLTHTDKRKEFIDKMDQTFLSIEFERVENVFVTLLFFVIFKN